MSIAVLRSTDPRLVKGQAGDLLAGDPVDITWSAPSWPTRSAMASPAGIGSGCLTGSRPELPCSSRRIRLWLWRRWPRTLSRPSPMPSTLTASRCQGCSARPGPLLASPRCGPGGEGRRYADVGRAPLRGPGPAVPDWRGRYAAPRGRGRPGAAALVAAGVRGRRRLGQLQSGRGLRYATAGSRATSGSGKTTVRCPWPRGPRRWPGCHGSRP